MQLKSKCALMKKNRHARALKDVYATLIVSKMTSFYHAKMDHPGGRGVVPTYLTEQ